jgi:hypothetical protein
MGWEDEHRQRLAKMPPDLRNAHEHSDNHRQEVIASNVCGCFYCCKTFSPAEIVEWCDDSEGVGQTALCPRCGIDSVIGDRAGFELTEQFLSRMRSHWF